MKIIRGKWLNGSIDGEDGSLLSSESGKMCCLGFLAKNLDADDNDILGVELPSEVNDICKWPTILFNRSYHLIYDTVLTGYKSTSINDNWEQILAKINDQPNVEQDIRESWIATGFKVLFDIDVEFVGEY